MNLRVIPFKRTWGNRTHALIWFDGDLPTETGGDLFYRFARRLDPGWTCFTPGDLKNMEWADDGDQLCATCEKLVRLAEAFIEGRSARFTPGGALVVGGAS